LWQLAALKLVEQGKITFDTAVGDYLPEFRNPIIVENTSTEKPSFKPAQTVVTLKHLLNFTSGLFRPDQSDKHTGMSKVHITGEIHQSADPASEFFRVLMVKLFSFWLVSSCQILLPGRFSRFTVEI
jgi:Beta-lactamase